MPRRMSPIRLMHTTWCVRRALALVRSRPPSTGLVGARPRGPLGGDHVPLGAEGVEALALGGPALAGVADERVERVLVVGHLGRPVGALDRPEQGGLRARAGLGR